MNYLDDVRFLTKVWIWKRIILRCGGAAFQDAGDASARDNDSYRLCSRYPRTIGAKPRIAIALAASCLSWTPRSSTDKTEWLRVASTNRSARPDSACVLRFGQELGTPARRFSFPICDTPLSLIPVQAARCQRYDCLPVGERRLPCSHERLHRACEIGKAEIRCVEILWLAGLSKADVSQTGSARKSTLKP